ncbi:hypothetical protein PVAP13_2KG262474, partial [Panicum virgatum]
ETFALLRYLLGALRPIETVYLRLSLCPREFRYLKTIIVTSAIHRGFGRRLPYHQFTNFLDLPALGRRQPPYMGEPLLRKLRGYFAEFLRESCLAPLSILYLPTCVGFGYSVVAPGMSLVEKQWLVHGAHTSAPQRLVLGPRIEAFSLPLLNLKK